VCGWLRSSSVFSLSQFRRTHIAEFEQELFVNVGQAHRVAVAFKAFF
jgi:hypothetical protein